MRLLCAGDCHEHAGEQDMCGLSRKVDGLSYKADGLIREAYFKQRRGNCFVAMVTSALKTVARGWC